MDTILNVLPIVIMAVVLSILIHFQKIIACKGKEYHAKIMTYMLIVLVLLNHSDTIIYKRMLIIYFVLLINRIYSQIQSEAYMK
jgi:hypothetical protein